MRAIVIGAAAVLAAGGPACGGPDPRDEDRAVLAKLVVDKFAFETAPQWLVANSSKECPDSLLALAEFVGNDRSATIDPWGTPYEMFCGAGKLPPGASGKLAVLSYGPDKKKGTADDIASWRPRP